MTRGGHLAILRDAKFETKESEAAAVDIAPVPGESFEQTMMTQALDLVQEMVRAFAQKMMDAEVEAACGVGYGGSARPG